MTEQTPERNPINSNTLTDEILNVANDLWGDFKHTDFGRIMLPFLLLRRLECVLEPTREAVKAAYDVEQSRPIPEDESHLDPDLYLPEVSGFVFYNRGLFTLANLGTTHTIANLESYIRDFSGNVHQIFEAFKFATTIDELNKTKLLYRIAGHFAKMDLHPDVVSDRTLSNVYEHLIRKFAASINEKAGEFMTPRDAVRLATKLVLHPDEEIFAKGNGVIRSIYDPTCGTGGFLSDAIALILDMGSTATIVPYGQELDSTTHALALTSMMIQGFKTENIKQGSTLSNDQLPNSRFHYGLANPPFGKNWDKDSEAVRQEHEKLGYGGRFGAGLPRISDGSMLFLMHLVSKMHCPANGGGRVGIILSGSPLFNGGAGSGESEIRRYLLESDYVEAIIALPNDMFFNTGIGTYLWILSNKKEPRRKNKVQLINATERYTMMRKSEGNKRRTLTEAQIDDIVREYDAFDADTFDTTRIFTTTDFAYRRIDVKRPLRAKMRVDDASITTFTHSEPFKKLSEPQQKAWRDWLKTQTTAPMSEREYTWAEQSIKAHHNQGDFGKTTKALGNALAQACMIIHPDYPIVTDAKGKPIADSNLNDTENLPYTQKMADIEAYFAQEVLPHVPDAWIDMSKVDAKDKLVGIVGYEINFNRYFYRYTPPRSLSEIDAELKATEARIAQLLGEVAK